MDNLIFISAQPDQVYFHWQVELYLYQFSKLGIQDRCYAVFGYTDDEPSKYIVELSKKYNIVWYKDERDFSKKNHYIPSIRPHILKKFFKDRPDLGKNVFYHDSDIFLVRLPKFELLLEDSHAYVSDTISYIGYDYIKECSKRYKDKYPELQDEDIFKKMCQCIDVSEDLIKSNQENSGGCQYLLKNIDSKFWLNVENDCVKLYNMLKTYEEKYPIDNHIQSWTTDMWCVLWNYLKIGRTVKVHSELNFSWATSNISDYYSNPIFHLAGVTDEISNDKFYKGKYINKNIFREYTNNKNIFDHISPYNATYEYVNIIKEYVDKQPKEICDKFLLKTLDNWNGLYIKDQSTIHFGKPVWRSEKYIIFYNSNSWILTSLQYESEISEKCGGFGSNCLDEPYQNGWNFKCSTEIINI